MILKIDLYLQTILKDVDLNDKVMSEELFGPILPVIKYKNIEDIKYYISKHKIH